MASKPPIACNRSTDHSTKFSLVVEGLKTDFSIYRSQFQQPYLWPG